jgi:fido (protein-threonine AMPylation protein)
MSIKYGTSEDPYIDPDTSVLKNLRGIKDQATLDSAEAGAVALRTYELRENPLKGNFDLDHLSAIHKYLFQDIYPWAGETRSLDITKGTSRFANHLYIRSSGEKVFKSLAEEGHLLGLEIADFSARASHYLAEINAIHPFREGNGRAQREFINHLAAESGYVIAWENAPVDVVLSSTIASFHGELEPLTNLISDHIKRITSTPPKRLESASRPVHPLPDA